MHQRPSYIIAGLVVLPWVDLHSMRNRCPHQAIVALHVGLQVLRVFYDRLVDESEQVWFLDTLKSVTQRHFHASFDALFQHLTRAPGTYESTFRVRAATAHCFCSLFVALSLPIAHVAKQVHALHLLMPSHT
jgi:uncharacterized membrane protein